MIDRTRADWFGARWARQLAGPAASVLAMALAEAGDAPNLAVIPAVVALCAAAGIFGGVSSAVATGAMATAFIAYRFGMFTSPIERVDLVELGVAVAAILLASVPAALLRKRAAAFFAERSMRFEAEAARRHVYSMIDDLDVIVWEATLEPPELIHVSRGAEWVLGYRQQELTGDISGWLSHVHPDDVDLATRLRAAGSSGGSVRSAEYRMYDRDGRTVWVSDSVWQPSEGRIHGRTIDISELKRAETRIAVVHAAAVAFDEANELKDASPKILDSICEALEWDLGLVWLQGQSGEHLVCVATSSSKDEAHEGFLEASRRRTMVKHEGLPGRVWASSEAAWILDVVNDENFPRAAAAEAASLHSAFGFPISIEEETIGVIEFFTHNIEQPDEEILKLMSSIGAQLGQFVRRSTAERAVRESEALKTAILDTALDCIISMDDQGRIVEFNPSAEEVFGYTRQEALGNELAELIIPPPLRERHREGIRRFLENGDTSILGRRLEMPAVRSDGSQIEVELAVTPVKTAGSVIFTGYLRDITENKRQERDRSFLDEVGALASSSLDHHSSMTGVAHKVVPYLADICLIDVIDEDRRVTRVAHVPGTSGDVPLFEFDRYLSDESDEHPIVKALRSGRSELESKISPSVVATLAATEEEAKNLEALDMKSFMVVPIATGSVIHGAITFIDLDRQDPYHTSDLVLAERVAKRVSRPLELSLLLRKRTKEARTLQQSLRPLTLPLIPCLEVGHAFRPATGGRWEMGGDFYDAFPYPQGQNRWGIVIGDVSGKGVQAAVLTSLVRNTVFSEALQEREPRRILLNLNQALIEFMSRTDADQFCTVTYAKVDPEIGRARVTFVSAGHPLPVVIRADGSMRVVGHSGSLMGVLPEPDLPESSVDLGPGDRMVFYTDGVTDARSEAGMFTEAGLLAALADAGELDATSTAAHIEEAVTSFVDGDHRDDVAVLVLRVPD